MTNGIELQILLGIDSVESQRNIQTYLTNLKKQLDTLDVTLNVKGGSENNKTFSQMESQIDQLQKQVQSLSKSLEKVGAGSLSSSFNNEVAESKKSLIALEDYVRTMNGRTKVELVGKGEEERVKSVVATFKDELGKLQKITYSPIFGDDKKTITSFEQVGRAINDTNFEEFNKKSVAATKQLKELGLQGKLSAESFDVLEKELQRAFTTTELDKVTNKMKELSKQDIRSDKWENALSNVKTQAQELVKTLDKIEQNTQVNVDTSQFNKLKSEIQSIANTEIKTDEDIKRINSEFSRLSETVTKVKNESNQFDNAFKKVNDTVLTISRTGIIANDSLRGVVGEIHKINSLDITLDEKIVMLRREIEKLNTEFGEEQHLNKMRKAMSKAALDVQDLNSSLEKTERTYRRTVSKMDTASLKAELSALSTIPSFTNQTDIDKFNEQINTAKSSLKTFNSQIASASRNSMLVTQAFSTAMEKFTIWMGASTIFYGAARGIKDLVDKTIELDTAMTNLKRVMDAPSYKFNEMLEQSIVNVDNLSGRLNEYLELVSEFARMNFNDIESLDMANTAQMLLNISDLDAKQSVDSLVAAMISFNIEAEKSVRIADVLNEVDNNFSITTKDLALSLNKASSTASAFGAELEDLIGYTTAISSVTRESGNITGNALKSIMSRMTTLPKAIDAINAAGVSIENLDGSVRPVSDIIADLAGKWDGLSDSQQQNTAVSIAGTYQLNRFLALMNNYGTVVESTNTALNSQGSALREQEKYNQSLEARLNRLNTAWYELAASVSEDVLYDGIVSVTRVLELMTKAGDSTVVSIGLLPTIFATVGVGVSLLSGRFTTFTGSIIQNIASQRASTASTNVLTASMHRLAIGTGAASVAFRSLLAASGVGVVLLGIGVAVSALTSKWSENIQKQEEFERANQKNIEALTKNKTQTEQLIAEYEKLSSIRETSNLDIEQEERYLKIQQELGEIFPSLIKYIDSNGQYRLKSSKSIEKEIELTNELIKAKKEEARVKAEETIQKKLDEIDGIQGEIGRKQFRLENEGGSATRSSKDAAKFISKLNTEITQLQVESFQASQEIIGNVFDIADAFTDIEVDSNVRDKVEEMLYSLDFSELGSEQLKDFSKELADIMEGMSQASASNDEKLFNEYTVQLQELFSTTKDFNPELDVFNFNLEKLKNNVSEIVPVIDSADESIERSADSTKNYAQKVEDLIESISKLESAEEQLVGVSNSQVESTQDLLFQYESLSNQLAGYSDEELNSLLNKQNLTESEKVLVKALQSRGDVIGLLQVMYPELAKLEENAIGLTYDQIKAIEEEQKANEILLKGYKLAKEGKLTAEQQMTLAQATGVKSRIENIKAEIIALELLDEQIHTTMTNAQFLQGIESGNVSNIGSSFFVPTLIDDKISSKSAELKELQDTLNSSVTTVDTFTKAIEEADTASKKKEKTTKSSIYITDKYKQALEKLNLEIEKQKSLREGESEHSDKYRKSLEAQIKLEKQKLDLIKSQQSSLESQIKSGKILETGLITTESKSPTSTSKTNLSGYSGTISSRYGNRILNGKQDPHRGIDIAQPMGTRLDANVSGKVVASGNAAKNGYDKSYGNLVVIEDGNGLKHLYAHLSEAIVKVGQQVSAGTQIGKIGSTGNSTGSHLHYEVNLNGKPIDPSQYVTDAKKGVVSVIDDTNDAVAKTQQNIDNAKSALIQSQQEELAQMKLIADLENERAKSILAQHDYKRGQYDQSIEYESTKLQELDINSARYTATLDNMIKYMNKKQKVNRQEQIDIQTMINSGKYHGEMLDWLKDRYAALTTEMKAQQIEINKTNFDIAMNVKAQSDEKLGDIEYAMNRLKGIQSLYDEGSGDWVEIQEQLVEAQKKNTAEIKLAYENLQKEMTARSYTAEGIKNMTDQLRSLSTAYWDSMAAEKAMTKSLKDSQEAMLKSIADDLINSYKDVYNEKKDAHLKALDVERDAEEKAHRQRIKELEDEMNLYRKNVQEKLDLINKQESERDYNMEITDLESERSKVAQKLNEVQFDNSYEGQAERKKLQEQLDKIDKDIAEKRHDRDIQLQTDALNEMLELKEQENQGFQDIETEKYESVIDNIDRQKQYWEKYYNDILNDERKFAQIREDVMNKNFDAIKKEFGEYIDEMNATMPELEDTMDGTMQAVGTSIRMNIIDSLKEALALMAEFEAAQAITGEYGGVSSGGSSGGGSSGGSSAKSLSNGDKQVLLGKYMTEILANQESNAGRKAAIKNKAYELANSGRGAGSTIGANESLNSALSSLSKEDLSDLASFFSSRAGSVVSSPYLQDYIKDFAKQLLSRSASLSIGGMIPKSTGGIDGKGGRSVIVHPEEIISNPIDSKNMVIASNIMERITKMITSPKLSMPTSPSLAGFDGGDVIFQVENMYATDQEVKSFGDKIGSIMKTKFGRGL